MTLTCVLVLLLQEPSGEDLKRDVERLRKQVELCEQQAVEDARTIQFFGERRRNTARYRAA